MYYRSMTLAERAEYEAIVREWFPNITLTFRFELDYPSQNAGDVDTQDPIDWSFYRNGFEIQGQLLDQMIIYAEQEGGRFHYFDAYQCRQMIREAIFASNDIMFPFMADQQPSSLVSGASVKSATTVRKVGPLHGASGR